MQFKVEHSHHVQASEDKVQPLAADLTRWPSWSPWLCLDPNTETTFYEDGQKMSWRSKVVGEGIMEVDQLTDGSISINLFFIKPFKSSAKSCLRWNEQGDGTTVTWEMEGNMSWYMWFLIPMMKGWIKMDYRRGLTRLASLAEAGKIPALLSLEPKTILKDSSAFIGVQRKNVPMDKLSELMEKDFQQVVSELEPSEGSKAICFYDKVNVAKGTFDYAAGIQYFGVLPDIPSGSNWDTRTIKNHEVLRVELQGPYDFLGDAWSMAMMSIKPKGYKQFKKISPYEVYEVGPMEVKSPVELKTYVDVPVR